jgi:hypothetical protein
MPKRSNFFQQLVLLLQSQLADAGFVQESALLTDVLTGGQVEVDVVVRSQLQGVAITLGFECTAAARPATVEWVREMLAKHQTLPVDKTILVSESGFTKEARKRAEAANALPLSLEEATEADWQTFITGLQSLRLGSFTFRPIGGSLHLLGTPVNTVPHDTVIRFNNGQETTLLEYIKGTLRRDELMSEVMRKWLTLPEDARPSTFEISVTATPEPGAQARLPDGEWRDATHCSFKAQVMIESVPLSLRSGALQGQNLAFGRAPNIFTDHNAASPYVVVNVLGDKGGVRKAGLLFPKSASGAPEIVHMKVELDSADGSA